MKELTYTKTFENKKNITQIFIPTNKKWKSTENDNLSILESGKDGVLFNTMINDINKAQRMVCLQSFLIQDTKIIDALVEAKEKRNVKIFIMDSAEARLVNSFEEDDSFITKDYKQMLEKKFKNNFIHRQANNLHAKFILIDPKTSPKGYIFTGNFNLKPFYENPELAVELNKIQITELFRVFVYHFWEYTTDEQTATSQFDKVKPINKFDNPKLKNILLTSPNEKSSNLKSTLLESVSKAKKEIQFSTFGFDVNHELSNKILQKLKAGVKITVYCRAREKVIKGNIDVLAQNGAEIYCHPLIHAKSLLIDKKEGYLFSANFESHGLDTGFEIGLKLNMKQTKDLIKIYKNWSNTYPYKYIHKSDVLDLKKYHQLDSDGRLSQEKTIVKEEQKIDTKNIQNGSDLVRLFSINEPSTYHSKKITIKATAKIVSPNFKYNITKNIMDGINLIEFQKTKNKKAKREKGLLLETSKITDIPNLLSIIKTDFKEFKIYAI